MKKVLNLLVGKYKVSIFAVPKLRRGVEKRRDEFFVGEMIFDKNEAKVADMHWLILRGIDW